MTFRVAACQMNSQSDKGLNLRTAERLIDEAARLGADLVALPEMFNIYGTNEEILQGREPEGGPTMELLARKARQHGIFLHGGSIPVSVPGTHKAWNATYLFDPAGTVVAGYRKIHLFDIDFPGRVADLESSRYEAGQEPVIWTSPHGVLGLTICYDLRFPELFRALTLAGAQLVFLPSAFTLYTGKDHWEVLIRARAVENQIFVAAPAQIGVHGDNQHCFGSTMIVDPWGTILARAPERECVVVADIDYTDLERVRAGLPCLQHRRPDAYARAVGDGRTGSSESR